MAAEVPEVLKLASPDVRDDVYVFGRVLAEDALSGRPEDMEMAVPSVRPGPTRTPEPLKCRGLAGYVVGRSENGPVA